MHEKALNPPATVAASAKLARFSTFKCRRSSSFASLRMNTPAARSEWKSASTSRMGKSNVVSFIAFNPCQIECTSVG